jgi:hypothetical protein
MATLLVNAKMNPALAARVDASVRGQSAAIGARSRSRGRRRLSSFARLLLVVAVLALVYGMVMTRRLSQRELERSRGALLETVRRESATLTPDDQLAVSRAEGWLRKLSGAYEGDVIDDGIRGPGALGAALSRPMVYVRGPIATFSASHDAIAMAAATSGKDALLVCLLEPAPARTERALLDKTRVAYLGGGELEARSPHVRRLHEAIVGLPLLAPSWAEGARTTTDASELARMTRQLERAPIERARQAAKAGLLLAAMDEPGEGQGPTELDGERPHAIRVGLVDVATGRVLLRIRRSVDPSWISPARRPTYASGLDSCALAFDIHERARN